jgi:hypothetical protein
MWQGIEVLEMKHEIEAAIDENDRSKFGEIPAGSFIVMVDQAQKPNVLSLFERQVYPSRINANGEAEVPYDVAGWTLPLQMGVEYAPVWDMKEPDKLPERTKAVEKIDDARKVLNLPKRSGPFARLSNPLKRPASIGLYKGYAGSMDEGWTRFVFDTFGIRYRTLMDKDVRAADFRADVVVLPSIRENSIVKGLPKDRYPDEYTGGIGDEGVDNLRKFVEDGGRLVCFDDSCEMVIKRFDLPIKNTVQGLTRSQFYCPGSILTLDVNTADPLSRGLNKKTAAYFTGSSAYEIKDGSEIRTVARYAEDDLLMSGWILGEKHIAGKTAIAAAKYGKGEIVLFAFRPQHRGQTFATFPFIFNALEK